MMQRCLNCGCESATAGPCNACGWEAPDTPTLKELLGVLFRRLTSNVEEQRAEEQHDRGYEALQRTSAFRFFTIRAFVPVAATYLLSIIGIYLFGDEGSAKASFAGPGTALLFTITHGVLPVFLYAALDKPSLRHPFGILMALQLTVWFGFPIAVLASMTGWLCLISPLIHLLFAKRGERAWVYIEYGSTSMALLMFLEVFSAKSLFPGGLVAAIGQAILLGLVGTLGRGLWVDELAEERSLRQKKLPAITWRHVIKAVGVGLRAFVALLIPFGLIGGVLSFVSHSWLSLIVLLSMGAVIAFGLAVAAFIAALCVLPSLPDSDASIFDFIVKPLEEFTQHVNGTLTREPDVSIPLTGKVAGNLKKIEFNCNGANVRLELSRNKKRRYLDLVFELNDPTSFRCEFEATHAVSQVASKLGVLSDVKTGYQPFDDHFLVRTNDTAKLQQVLSPVVRDAMLRLKIWIAEEDLANKSLCLIVQGSTVTFRLGAYLQIAEHHIKFYEESKRAFLELRANLGQA